VYRAGSARNTAFDEDSVTSMLLIVQVSSIDGTV